jgi:hypothetical protein
MPKLGCPCGYTHNLSSIPDEGYITIRDRDYEQLIEAHRITYEIAGSGLLSEDHPRYGEWEAAFHLTFRLTRRLYQCPECGRLLWERSTSENYECYLPEVR